MEVTNDLIGPFFGPNGKPSGYTPMILTLHELLSAATAAGEAERARYRVVNMRECHIVITEKTPPLSDPPFTGTEADCQRYIAERGNRAVFAYLEAHAGECEISDYGWSLASVEFDDAMCLLARCG